MKPDRLTRLAYGLGAVPFGAKLQLFGLLLLFYNQLLGLPAAAVSAILAASVVLDAVWDPLVGQISDSTRSRWGRRHLSSTASRRRWRSSSPSSGGRLPVVATGTPRLARGVRDPDAAAREPARASERGTDAGTRPRYDERTALIGLRYIFGNIGAGISFILAFGVFLRSTPEHPFGQLDRTGYAPFGATVAGRHAGYDPPLGPRHASRYPEALRAPRADRRHLGTAGARLGKPCAAETSP